jgi:hypothetical protein
MPTTKVNKSLTQALAQLHYERDRIDRAIAKLENDLGQAAAGPLSNKRGRGRAAQARSKATRTPIVTKARSRAGWTEAARKAAADRMRSYWAAQAEGKTKTPRAKKAKQRSEKSQAAQVARRSTSGWTETARSEAAERMRKYWAERRDAKQASV